MHKSVVLLSGACLFLALSACSEGGKSGGNSENGNHIPVANAGVDNYVAVKGNAVLDASASSDSDNDALTYAWTLVSAPEGSQITAVNDPSAKIAGFTPDVAGDYLIKLIVNDGNADSEASTLKITGIGQTINESANVFRDILTTLQGSEFPKQVLLPEYTYNGAVNIDLTNGMVNVSGFAFCLPQDPLATAATSSIPPQSVFGCNHVVDAPEVVVNADGTVTVTLNIPMLFIQGSGGYSVSGISSGSLAMDGYISVKNTKIEVTANITKVGEGVYNMGGIVNATVTLGTIETSLKYSGTGVIESLVSVVSPLIQPVIIDQLKQQTEVAMADIISALQQSIQEGAGLFILK